MDTMVLVPLLVIVPLAVAFIIPMVSRRLRWTSDLLGVLTMGCLTLLSLATFNREAVIAVGNWVSPVGIPLGIEMRLDGLSSLLLISINVIGLAAALFSVQYMNQYTSKLRYYSLFLFMVAGMNGVVLSGDFFNLFVFMEIAAISSYALVGFGCEHEELEASFKYLVLGSVASAFILIGIGIVYATTGTLNMTHVATRFAEAPLEGPIGLALALFLCGFGLKAALVPFHAWLPDAHPSAPAPVSAMLSGVVIKALGIYVIARLLFNVFGATEQMLAILRGLGTISMIVGVMLAIGQWDMKRLFAYHSISQIGYMALGLGLGTPLGIVGGLFHMVNHSVFKSLLFLNAGAVEYSTGTRDLKRLGGLREAMPATSGTSMVASMSIAGIPPFNGFWSKLIIVMACVESGHHWLALVAVLVSMLTLASFLKVQRYAFFEAAKSATGKIKDAPALMVLAMIILALLCVGMSLFVCTGLETPLLIDRASEALRAGVFSLPRGALK
ncbi:MAG: NADH/ubiquinone/plastoquinone (complex I) [Lentisphaerae bacterium]|nr:NADH/ubiquinone/plastoquinone (complex I) [Lentisphaerota bacterium]